MLLKQNKHTQCSNFYHFMETQFLQNPYCSTGCFYVIIVVVVDVVVVSISNSIRRPCFHILTFSLPTGLQQTAVYHKDIDKKAATFIRENYIHFLQGVREASLTFSKRAVFNSACSVSLCFFFCSKDSFNSLSFPWRCCSLFSFSFRRL